VGAKKTSLQPARKEGKRVYYLIFGSRDYPNPQEIHTFVQSLHPLDHIISGHARGADRIAEQAAQARGMSCTIFPAQWEIYGRSAGFERNQQMVNYLLARRQEGSEVRGVAFWHNQSRGPAHTITLLKGAQIPVQVFRS
jgi:hypothetical protein